MKLNPVCPRDLYAECCSCSTLPVIKIICKGVGRTTLPADPPPADVGNSHFTSVKSAATKTYPCSWHERVITPHLHLSGSNSKSSTPNSTESASTSTAHSSLYNNDRYNAHVAGALSDHRGIVDGAAFGWCVPAPCGPALIGSRPAVPAADWPSRRPSAPHQAHTNLPRTCASRTLRNRPPTPQMTSETPPRTVFVSSRKSQLAMAQTNTVIAMLETRFPALRFVVGQQDTVGDQVLDRHLSDLGTTTASGLFTKSLEEALLAKTASFAVHSLKDMPTTLPDGLVLAAITKRESPEDAAVIHPKHKAKGITTLKQLPEGSVIGTSSLRREALLRSQFPTFEIKTLRGNIQTRLAKLDEHDDYDAIIVAACGFRRGELGDRIDEILPMDTFGYGVGQGSIGVECRADDQEVNCEALGKQLAERFWDNELARKVLGKTREKRALTYGDAEAPGDAAAAAAEAERATKVRKTSDRVLQAFRAIGVVADDVPIVWYGMGQASFATASLGKSFAVYKCDKLTPVLVSPQLPKRIAALAVQPKKHLTFTACGRQIVVWRRVDRWKTLLGHQGAVKQMMTVGNVLFSLDDQRSILIWDLQ
ncbi:unnamed protein product [Phytophthora lilii]|uniref:hydroxymethylbilane synthase n=1 Tax=Phytophthora lilii TaxID=2077276 RepID=A0A9W6TY54_9STRA|nr:unnamed protein product [Phytophthora lilii]